MNKLNINKINILKYSNTRYGVNITNIIDTEKNRNKIFSKTFIHSPPGNSNLRFTKLITSIPNHKNTLLQRL